MLTTRYEQQWLRPGPELSRKGRVDELPDPSEFSYILCGENRVNKISIIVECFLYIVSFAN